MRVLRPGGTLVFIGNDLRSGEFAELLRAAATALVTAGGRKQRPGGQRAAPTG